MLIVQVILTSLFLMLATLPFTYNWLSKRRKYIARLNSLGFDENEDGSISKLTRAPSPSQEFLSADPESNIGASMNPGFTYAASGATMLLPNAAIGLYKFWVFQRREWLQRRQLTSEQRELLKALKGRDPDLAILKIRFTKEF